MKPQKNILEWLVFAVSALLVAGILLFLLVTGSRQGEEPPLLFIELGAPTKAREAFRLPVRVRNNGDQTAEECTIEVVLRSGEREVERGELTIALIPKRSAREGWVTFQNDPKCCTIEARAVGFTKP